MKQNIYWFDEIDKSKIAFVGGKGANLGEMTQAKIPVPYGFVVSAQAYYEFIKETGLDKKIAEKLKSLDHKNNDNLHNTAKEIQKLILSEKVPNGIALDIMKSYLDLPLKAKKHMSLIDKVTKGIPSQLGLKNPFVAIRSSATAEDLPGASFAGQQETYLNVSGEHHVVDKVHHAWASLFTPRAIFYREEQKFDHMKVSLAAVVQLMVCSESSGVMFTIDPLTNDRKKIIVEAIYGLGEMIVGGEETPDHYEVDKHTLSILSKKSSKQLKMMIKKGIDNERVDVPENIQHSQKISDKEIQNVAELGARLEKHYKYPQDIEWAIEENKVYIVQTRPITTIEATVKNKESKTETIEISKMKLIVKGDPASPGIASGIAKIIFSPDEMGKVNDRDILVTVQTNPDFVPAMKRASAIVTERGGRTSHAAIVSRELGIPAVVGADGATKFIKDGQMITVSGSKGEVYEGEIDREEAIRLSAEKNKRKTGVAIKTATKVYVNLATPNRIEEVAAMNCDGVGLLRAEFMIADIGTHPRKLIKDHKEKVFIDKLSSDLLKFCQSFNPRPVVYRATDFKTNEYANLIGGKEFEPFEPNPMLGYRGAYRYMSDPKVFELELEAIKTVRNKHGFKNLMLMLPFVRNTKELIEVKKIIAASGLSRSSNFKLWMMVEIPSNVILLDDFCKIGIDGVSIGSNDLTMLILGTDRDNSSVASEFDERDPAVLWAIEHVVKTCHKYNVTCSICGQAPSDYPDLVEKLVNWGITSVSVNSDAIDRVRENIHEFEKILVHKR